MVGVLVLIDKISLPQILPKQILFSEPLYPERLF